MTIKLRSQTTLYSTIAPMVDFTVSRLARDYGLDLHGNFTRFAVDKDHYGW